LSSKANRIHHHRSSRRHIRNSSSSCSPRRRRSKDALKDTVSPRRSRKHWIKPDRCDSSSSLEAFLAHFDTCATYNRWREDDRLAHLRSCLTGRAAEVLWRKRIHLINCWLYFVIASEMMGKLRSIVQSCVVVIVDLENHYVQCFMTFKG